jgi:hypothetical protein
MLSHAVEEVFDLNAVLRAAIGLAWKSLPADQQAELVSAFRKYTVSNYTANFNSYTGQNYRALPASRMLPNGDAIVRTEIARSDNTPVEIDYLMRQTASGWKAVDVLSGGTIGQAAVQRPDFRGLLTSGGAPRCTRSCNGRSPSCRVLRYRDPSYLHQNRTVGVSACWPGQATARHPRRAVIQSFVHSIRRRTR